MRGSGVRQAAIDGQITLRHSARSETLLEAPPDFLARQMTEPVDRAYGAVDVLDDKSSDAVVDDLRHGATIEGDDRGATSHGFDHDQTERLRPVEGNQQHDRAAEELR